MKRNLIDTRTKTLPVDSALEKAGFVPRHERPIEIGFEDAQTLLTLLENPVPNQKLSTALQRYQEKIQFGSLVSDAETAMSLR